MSATATAMAGRKLNLNISERARADLSTIARESDRSMTEVIRLGISLAKIALDAERKGYKLAVVTADGEPIKELILPS